MAKRPSEENDPFDDPFDDIDDSGIDSLRISDTDMDDDLDFGLDDAEVAVAAPKRPKKATTPGTGPTPGQIIVGAIQVILIAAIALIIFLALSFGAVFGGQKLGLVPTRAPGGTGPLISLLPTAGAAQAQNGAQATALPPNAPTPVPPTAVPTTDPTCAKASEWWNSQPIQSNYQYFTAQALNDVRAGTFTLSAILEQMKIHRGIVANTPIDPCLKDAQDALLRGFDATSEAARAIGAKDDAALATQQDNATKAYTDVAAILGKFGVSVVVPTPTS